MGPILPWPKTKVEIRQLLTSIDDQMLSCTEDFIRLQVKSPTADLLSRKATCKLDSPQARWFNIYSVFNANQQLNEACNKLWAGTELMHVTDEKVWNELYDPVGGKFNGSFVLGTTIPTLYYAQLSAIVSILSIYGCIPVMINQKRYYMLRAADGWQLFSRGDYAQNHLGISSNSWHEVILRTFQAFKSHGLELPNVNLQKTFDLKKLRNEMHYEILGDLRMWRAYTKRRSFFKIVPLVMETIGTSIETIRYIKKITTGCDERFEDLRDNLEKV